MIIGYLPISQIMNMANQAHFSTATPVLKPILQTGSVDTEGDQVVRADQFRANTGLTGAGVTVGILSDSINEVNGGIAASQATGDLPPNVNVLEDDPNPAGATDEGRAMAEIVNDIAPGAGLAFHTGAASPQDFAQGILDLADTAGAKVIADDLLYADEPMFNDGIIAQAANTVNSQGVFYASAAGNNANDAWTAGWNPTTATVGGSSGTFENFSSIPGARDVLQRFSMPAFTEMQLSFQWDSAFLEGGSPLSQYQVPQEMDVLITDGTTTNVLATFNTNTKNTDEALQFVDFINPNPITTGFAMAFRLQNPGTDPAPTTLRWVNVFVNEGGVDIMAQGQGSATSFGQKVAIGVAAIGAVPWFQPNTSEPFTALGGPVQINFDSNGFRLASPEIRDTIPAVAGPDGVSTTFFGSPNPATGQAFAFFGTSAAAPHIAGEAALYFQQVPSAIPDDILLHMEDTAVPVNDQPGFNNISGFGLTIMSNMTATNAGPEGDRFEFNETSDTASQMGVLGIGRNLIEALSIQDHTNGLPDYDWYQWTTGAAGLVTAQVHIGSTAGPLEMHLFTIDANGTLIQLGEDQTPIGGLLDVSANVAANQPLLVEVKGLETAPGVWGQGHYSLDVTLQ
jgi:hypothetical protein